jgi:hypothetical protein
MGVLVQKGDFVLVDVDVTGEKSGQKPPQNKKDNSGF